MHDHLRGGAIVLALLGSMGIAFAQAAPETSSARTNAELSLTDQQKQAIWQQLSKAKSERTPANLQASLGTSVPNTLRLHPLPRSSTDRIGTTSAAVPVRNASSAR